MKIKRILTATAAAALVITSVFAGGNFKEVVAIARYFKGRYFGQNHRSDGEHI